MNPIGSVPAFVPGEVVSHNHIASIGWFTITEGIGCDPGDSDLFRGVNPDGTKDYWWGGLGEPWTVVGHVDHEPDTDDTAESSGAWLALRHNYDRGPSFELLSVHNDELGARRAAMNACGDTCAMFLEYGQPFDDIK